MHVSVPCCPEVPGPGASLQPVGGTGIAPPRASARSWGGEWSAQQAERHLLQSLGLKLRIPVAGPWGRRGAGAGGSLGICICNKHPGSHLGSADSEKPRVQAPGVIPSLGLPEGGARGGGPGLSVLGARARALEGSFPERPVGFARRGGQDGEAPQAWASGDLRWLQRGDDTGDKSEAGACVL